MKTLRTIAFLLLVLAVSMLACRREDQDGGSSAGLRILTSFYPMHIMALNVTHGAEGVRLENLAPPTAGCLHDYALSTADMKKFEKADILVINGAGMEGFMDRIAGRYPHLKIASLAEGIPLIREGGGGQFNPHVWVSVTGAVAQVKNLGRRLETLDPARASLYRKNTAVYVERLEGLRKKMHLELDPFRGKRIVTFHEAFPYFAREFGLVIAAVVEREPGSEPGAAELRDTIEIVKRSGVPALFAEPQYPSKAAEVIARESGARLYVLDPAVTGPLHRDAYIAAMEKNMETLARALR